MNHDNDYHDDINYGNRFPDDWYWDNAAGITFRKANPKDSEELCSAALHKPSI